MGFRRTILWRKGRRYRSHKKRYWRCFHIMVVPERRAFMRLGILRRGGGHSIQSRDGSMFCMMVSTFRRIRSMMPITMHKGMMIPGCT